MISSVAIGKVLARPALALALLVGGASALGLAGCSGGSVDPQYCALLEQNKQTLADLSTDVTELNADTIAKLREIEQVAPATVKDDWRQFNDYLQAVLDKDETTVKAKADSMVTVGATIDKSLSEDCNLTMPSS